MRNKTMKLAVGYPVFTDDIEIFIDAVEQFHGDIDEVYFAWIGEPSGRSATGIRNGEISHYAKDQLEEHLKFFKKMGLKLDILFNANCYGHGAVSYELADRIRSTIEHIAAMAGLDAVTTTSPFIARIVKEHYPNLDVRASVNMRIGTVQAMEYIADVYDGFYIQRDYNRDLKRIEQLHRWSREKGKKLYILANSGCLKFCSTQMFHDNMVAHEQELVKMKNVPCETLACRTYLKNPDHWISILQATWIRPEDLYHYQDYFHVVKLATRMHQNPHIVIQAYAQQNYHGNLLDILEPGHSQVAENLIIDNAAFPLDWFEHITQCGGRCNECSYCKEILNTICNRTCCLPCRIGLAFDGKMPL